MRSRTAVLMALSAAGIATGACSDSTGGNRRAVGISFSTQPPPAALMAGSQAANFDITVSNGGNTLVITRAQLVLREMELKMTASSTCADGTVEDSCEEIEFGPILVDLPVTPNVLTPISAQIPGGTYNEIEFDIRRPGSDPADVAFVNANPNFDNVSIRVEGTLNGTAFVFTSELDQEVQLDFLPPLVVDGGVNNVTIQVDVRSWFTNTNGTIINPTTANPGQSNASIVAEKIRVSLRALEDDDRNGQ